MFFKTGWHIRLFPSIRSGTFTAVSNAFSLVAGFLCCLLLTACRSDKSPSPAISTRAEYENYQKEFARLDEELRKDLDIVKSGSLSGSIDSSHNLVMRSVDKKADFYKQQITNKLSKYHVLIQKAESGQMSEEEIKKYREEYKRDFATFEDAYHQMQTALKEIQQKYLK